MMVQYIRGYRFLLLSIVYSSSSSWGFQRPPVTHVFDAATRRTSTTHKNINISSSKKQQHRRISNSTIRKRQEECDIDFTTPLEGKIKCAEDIYEEKYYRLLGGEPDDIDEVAARFQYIDNVIKILPIANPIIAYFMFNTTVKYIDLFLDLLSSKNWVAVDGGAYMTQIITPAVNGIVLPAISILFGTLVSQTISSLRNRQVDVRECLINEGSQLAAIDAAISCFSKSEITYTVKCREYLTEYAIRLTMETKPWVDIKYEELNGVMHGEMKKLLKTLNTMLNDKNIDTNTDLILSCYTAVNKLSSERAKRISTMQCTFPPLHYAILMTLAASIMVMFLLETDQPQLLFLAETELKVLWTCLIGCLTSLFCVCWDLTTVFQGSYDISKSVKYLYEMRDNLVRKGQETMAYIELDGTEIC